MLKLRTKSFQQFTTGPQASKHGANQIALDFQWLAKNFDRKPTMHQIRDKLIDTGATATSRACCGKYLEEKSRKAQIVYQFSARFSGFFGTVSAQKSYRNFEPGEIIFRAIALGKSMMQPSRQIGGVKRQR